MGYANGTNGTARQLSEESAAAHAMPDSSTDTRQPKNTKVALYQKLLRVMEECGYIQKDKRNSFHGYNYASESAIKERLHASLVKHRLLFLPSAAVTGERTERTGVGRDGKESFTTTTTLRIQFRFVDADSGESEGGEFVGTGSDSGDKGAYKAITGAIKYILTSWFLIATGDDPENQQAPQPETRPQAPPEVREPRKPPASQTAAHKPWKSFGEMKEYFQRVREKVGEVIYAEELAKSGVEHPAQFKSTKTAADCFNRLWAVATKPEVA